jgi:hypothetical protein
MFFHFDPFAAIELFLFKVGMLVIFVYATLGVRS